MLEHIVETTWAQLSLCAMTSEGDPTVFSDSKSATMGVKHLRDLANMKG